MHVSILQRSISKIFSLARKINGYTFQQNMHSIKLISFHLSITRNLFYAETVDSY